MTKLIRAFLKDESGTTAIEYCVMAALVSLAAAGTLPTIGLSVSTVLGKVLAVGAGSGASGS